MHRTKSRWFAFLSLACAALIASAAKLPASDNQAQAGRSDGASADLLKARLELAKKGYEAAAGSLDPAKRPANMEVLRRQPIVVWSIRWLNAERELSSKKEDQIAALEAHLKRIKRVQEKMKKLAPGIIPEMEILDVDWYVIEAEIMLAREKAK